MAKNKTPASKKPKNPPTPSGENQDGDEDDEDEDDDEGDEGGDDENRRLNGLVTARLKRELKPFQKMLADLTASVSALAEKTSKPVESDDDDDSDDDSDDAPPSGKKGKKNASEKVWEKRITAAEKKIADAEKRAKEAETKQREQEEKAKRHEEDAQLATVLSKHGITDPKVARSVILTLRADGVIFRDEESGKLLMRSTDKYNVEAEVDPDVGFKKWVAGDGRVFLPAVQGAGGSGGGGGNIGHPFAPSMTRQQVSKLSPEQRAAVEIERASRGLPPLE